MAGNYGGSPDVKHDPRGMKFYLPLDNGEGNTWNTYMVTFLIGAHTCDPIKKPSFDPCLRTSYCRRRRSSFLLTYELRWTRSDTHRGTPQPEGAGSWSSACKGLPIKTGRAKCETKSGASIKEYMSSVASLLWVWLARLVHVSFQTFALYLPGSPGVR